MYTYVRMYVFTQASEVFQHLGDGAGSYDAVVWDAAPPSHQSGNIPPSDPLGMEEEEEGEEGRDGGDETRKVFYIHMGVKISSSHYVDLSSHTATTCVLILTAISTGQGPAVRLQGE